MTTTASTPATLAGRRLTVIGTGYLGATHAACMAELGFEVLGLDVDPEKVAALQAGPRCRSTSPASTSCIAQAGGRGQAAVHHLRRGGRGRSATCTSSASAPRRSGASSPPTCATSTPPSTRSPRTCGGRALVVGEVDRAGRHRGPPGRAPRRARARGRRRRARLEPGVPARGLRRRGHAASRTGWSSASRRTRAEQVLRARLRAAARRGRADGRHRLPDRGAGQGQRERLPGHEDLLHQRDGGGLRDRARRRHAARPGAGARPAHRRPVPQRGPRVRRRLPAQGHPRVHGAGRASSAPTRR